MAVTFGLASAYLKSFDVAPTHASLSGTVSGDPQYGGVSETFIADFDSAAEVWWFVGDVGSPGKKWGHFHNCPVEVF